MCFALVVGAGLLLQSLHRLSSVDLGYESDRVLTAEVFSNWSHQTTEQKTLEFYAQVLEKVRAIPRSAVGRRHQRRAARNIVPGERPIRIHGVSSETAEAAMLPLADANLASDQYFETLGVPVVRGREIRPPIAPTPGRWR